MSSRVTPEYADECLRNLKASASIPAASVAGASEQQTNEARCAVATGSLSASRAEALAAKWDQLSEGFESRGIAASKEADAQTAASSYARANAFKLCADALRREVGAARFATATENIADEGRR